MYKKLFSIILLSLSTLALPARGMPLYFTATLEGSQEVPAVATAASGSATLALNAAQDRLEIMIELFGLDLDGAQTPDAADNVVAGHIHAAPAGANGGVVFGLFSPSSDLNGDLLIDAAAGTISTAWDLAEGVGTTLAAQLPSLLSAGLYLNIHTLGNPAGEVRGQIVAARVPAPGGALLLGTALLALGFTRRRAGG